MSVPGGGPSCVAAELNETVATWLGTGGGAVWGTTVSPSARGAEAAQEGSNTSGCHAPGAPGLPGRITVTSRSWPTPSYEPSAQETYPPAPGSPRNGGGSEQEWRLCLEGVG